MDFRVIKSVEKYKKRGEKMMKKYKKIVRRPIWWNWLQLGLLVFWICMVSIHTVYDTLLWSVFSRFLLVLSILVMVQVIIDYNKGEEVFIKKVEKVIELEEVKE